MDRVNVAKPVRSKERFLVFGSPAIEQEEINAVVQCLQSGWIGTGPKVAKFEEEFREYVNGPYTVAVGSCTAALHLSLISLNLAPGDEVITTPMTFCATVNTIIHAGLTPVLADIDPVTMNIAPDEIERRITPRTRAILPVHFAGRPCDMSAICEIAERHDLRIVEDCAHAIETTIDGQHAGTFGEFGCFSFYVTKNVVTAEGGMVVARNAPDAARIKSLALHGMDKDAWRRFGDDGYKHYDVIACGFKYNMTDIQAAMGIPQLRRVEENLERRNHIWRRYERALSDLPVTLPAPVPDGERHAHHLFPLLIDPSVAPVDRDTFLSAMAANNIGVGVHYLSVPEHRYYQELFGWSPDEWPAAARIGRQTVSIPLSPKLTEEDVDDVIFAVRSILC